MARPTKQIHKTHQMLSCDQKDLLFFNEHKGKLSLSSYLIEAGYNYAGQSSRDEHRILEIKELKKEIEELKKQIFFERSKNKPNQIELTEEVIKSRDKWWLDKSGVIKESYNQRREPNWDKMFLTAQTQYKDAAWSNKKEIKTFVEQKLKTV